MKQKLIRDLKAGDAVLNFFVVRKKEIKQRKATGELYLSFEFGDSSGRIRGTLWNNIEPINSDIKISDVVKVKGKVITYRDGPHISIEKIRTAVAADKVVPEEFLPRTDKEVNAMYDELLQVIKSIEDVYLRKLLDNIFKDKQFKQQFTRAPAAKLWHHNYLGGLLEHTLSLTRLCDIIQQHYPQVKRDLLLTGALLHDIGKVVELSTAGFIDYSTEGRLVGHITIAAQIVNDKINEINDFPVSTRNQLLHCILSHHGLKERGSPVVPMTLEAVVLNYADELDSRITAFLRIMKKEKEPGKTWSNYVNLLDRFIYLGE